MDGMGGASSRTRTTGPTCQGAVPGKEGEVLGIGFVRGHREIKTRKMAESCEVRNDIPLPRYPKASV